VVSMKLLEFDPGGGAETPAERPKTVGGPCIDFYSGFRSNPGF
jgi:hypothetical protein